MSKYTTATSFFEERGPEDIERFVDKNLDISQQIYALLEEKKWSQKDLATYVGKSEAEISKWLSGTHNLTLKSIAKLEAAFEADIIMTPLKAAATYRKVEYVTFTAIGHTNPPIPSQEGYETDLMSSQIQADPSPFLPSLVA